MAELSAFNLWLEFECYPPDETYDPIDDFANIQVRLPDGRKYAMNAWTFAFLRRARYPWPYRECIGEPEEYLLTPDLFVERLDRRTLERIVSRMLVAGEMRPEWLCPPDDESEY